MTNEEKEEALQQLDKDLAAVSMFMLTLASDSYLEGDLEMVVIGAKIDSSRTILMGVINDIENILKNLNEEEEND